MASLAGLEAATESGNPALISVAVNKILLLHSLILSFGGIPLLYNGDALGVTNDYSYRDDPSKIGDNHWIHRPKINWESGSRYFCDSLFWASCPTSGKNYATN